MMNVNGKRSMDLLKAAATFRYEVIAFVDGSVHLAATAIIGHYKKEVEYNVSNVPDEKTLKSKEGYIMSVVLANMFKEVYDEG